MGELMNAAQREQLALQDSSRRVTIQQRIAEDVNAANAEYALKLTAMQHEAAALDAGAKDYENKLKAIQNKEKQLTQEHENELTAIKDKAEIERNQKILAAETQFNDRIASGLTQVLMGHAGMKLPFPANLVAAPVLAAGAFASMMAFQDGGVVPGTGVGRGDSVPAMLEPGEGVVPGGVMDGLSKMARSGDMAGGGTHYHVTTQPTYHLQALDTAGMAKILDTHSATLSKHVSNELRKMNH